MATPKKKKKKNKGSRAPKKKRVAKRPAKKKAAKKKKGRPNTGRPGKMKHVTRASNWIPASAVKFVRNAGRLDVLVRPPKKKRKAKR